MVRACGPSRAPARPRTPPPAKALLADLIERGLPTERSLLFVIDGAKALRRAIADTFEARALIQRCRQHKKRDVTDALPERLRASGPRRDESGLRDARH